MATSIQSDRDFAALRRIKRVESITHWLEGTPPELLQKEISKKITPNIPYTDPIYKIRLRKRELEEVKSPKQELESMLKDNQKSPRMWLRGFRYHRLLKIDYI